MGNLNILFPELDDGGFSALGDGGIIKGLDGKEYPLELDAVIWVKAYPKPKEVK